MPVHKQINTCFFDHWTPQMAYVLGYLFADGSLDVNKRGGHYFSFHMCDRPLLVAMRSAMGSNHKIALRKGVGNERNRYRLQVGSVYMCGKLEQYGMAEQKAYTMCVPDVPKAVFGHFVRGYFDGDGNVWVGFAHKQRKTVTTVIHTTFTSCSQEFLYGLRERLHAWGMGRGSFIFSRRAHRLQYSVNDSIMLYQLMYADVSGGLELPHKRKRFEKYIRMRP